MNSPTHAISIDRSSGKRSALRARRWRTLERVSLFEVLEPRRLLSAGKSTKSTANLAHTNYVVVSQNSSKPADDSSVDDGLTPSEIQDVYGVNQISFSGGISGTGAGQTIAIVDAYDDPDIQNDLDTFDAQFDLPNITVTRVSETGSTTNLPGTDSTGGWETEESLDVEWSHAIAPAANILLVEANSTSNSDLILAAANTARNYPGVVVVSMSFSGGESFNEATQYDSIFTSPSGKGVTFLAATGDNGTPSGYPAYSPNVVAVGGTILSVPVGGGAAFLDSYTSETGWSNPIIASATESGNTVTITTSAATPTNFQSGETVTIAGVSNSSYDGTFTVTGAGLPGSNQFTYKLGIANLASSSGGTAVGGNNGGSGGGQSTVESKPTYQNGVQSSTHRTNPDVSLAATFQDSNNQPYGVDVYDSFDDDGSPWIEVGGTSLATPMWAALIAIADQGRSLLGLGSLDGRTQTLPLLYELPTSDFHDITTGNNGLAAGTGYDLVTGLGTPIANLVVAGLVGATISGTVFNDANSNGVQNTGESGQAGVTVYDDIDNNGVFDPLVQTTFASPNVPVPIPDVTTITSTTTISGVVGAIDDVNVEVNITHTYDSDLVITLISPNGTQITLASHDGRNGHNYTNTIFDDQASTSISSGRAPFTGSYKPIGSLATLNGATANGTWTLQVADTVAQDSGTLNSWSLQITSGADFSATTDANGNYEIVNLAPGTHYIREVTPANYTETAPASGVYQVTVAASANITGLNFGNGPAVPPPVLGDFNRNGQLDAGDISAAMMALTNLDNYLATYQVTPTQLQAFDDVNQDGHFNNADLQALLNLLIGQGGNSSPAAQQNASSSVTAAQSVSQPASPSAITSEGYTDPQPASTAAVSAGSATANSTSALRQLLVDDLRYKTLSERYRLLRFSAHISSLNALEKLFTEWPG